MKDPWVVLSVCISLATMLGMCVTVWFKVSKESTLNANALEDHKNQLALITKSLAEHDSDVRKHRNPDSEQRIKDLVEAVQSLDDKNTTAHDKIMTLLMSHKGSATHENE